MAFRSRAIQQEKIKSLKKPRNKKKKTNDNVANLEKMLLNNVASENNAVNAVEEGDNDLSILDMLPNIAAESDFEHSKKNAVMPDNYDILQETNADVNPIEQVLGSFDNSEMNNEKEE